MNIEAVPESVPWSKVSDFLSDLGLSLDGIAAEGIEIHWSFIKCRVFALNANGSRFADPGTGKVVYHDVCIRLDHDEAGSAA